ncbi:hypothetical protein ZIOFF_070884 [Zingiber officinale]|uniref:E3 ubiquitin-protein ligase RMA n=1 Tax=Zingiber officinale TaxID=94328 RepID=A0A8J5C361_ZINOF|nr:hypothetical protein ZIOFF_070884 [Zingiber officinale]
MLPLLDPSDRSKCGLELLYLSRSSGLRRPTPPLALFLLSTAPPPTGFYARFAGARSVRFVACVEIAEYVPEPFSTDACMVSSTMDKPRDGDPPACNTQDDTAPVTMMSGCFDCSICLDLVVDPVVTLCGHLFCWPCIYKWMQAKSMSNQQCPVCKAFLSQDTIVPLFGRGRDSGAKVASGVPLRPAMNFNRNNSARNLAPESQFRHHVNDSIADNSSPLMTDIGGLAIAVLPWFHSRQYALTLSGNNPRLQRQQLQVVNSLHQIWVFLFCCAVVCLLLF